MHQKSFILILAIVFFLGFGNAEKAKGSTMEIHAGAGLSGYFAGNGIVFNGSVLFKPGTNVHLGVESGIYLLRFSPTVIMLPILATAYYTFPVSGKVKPYLGGSFGIMINLDMNPTGTGLGIFLRPGMVIPLSNGMDFNIETRVGGIDGVFVVLMQAAFGIKL